MTIRQFAPFPMPDFKDRPDGISKSLKDAYVYLRQQGFPDKDLFIYPQGEFSSFKGDILSQRPEPGETVSSGTRVILIAAVPGICELMPDLFTDHRGDFFDEEFNTRGGARRLFAIFDSAMLKMYCRLEWIRDIYGGIDYSEIIINYLGRILNLPERELKQITPEILGYVLPSLYGYLGTEEAMRVYLATVMEIDSRAHIGGIEEFKLAENAQNRLGEKWRLGSDLFLGQNFKGAQPKVKIDLLIESTEMLRKIIPQSEGEFLLEKILSFCVPQTAEAFELNVIPDRRNIRFKTGGTYLGYGTVLGDYPE
jgi:hypothetical protein